MKAARTQPCYRRPTGRTPPSSGCWPQGSGKYANHTRAVRLLIETMGGPSWQTVYLCDKHRREAEAAGLVRSGLRSVQ